VQCKEKKKTFETFLQLTFAITEFFRALCPESYRRSTNQPPKRTQQHHYHFTVDIMFTGMYFVTVLFVFSLCLTEARCASSIQNFNVLAGAMGDEDVILVSIICVNLKDYHNQCAPLLSSKRLMIKRQQDAKAAELNGRPCQILCN